MAEARRRPGPALIAGVVVAVAILLSLGTWQVQRLHWKEALIQHMEAAPSLPPISIEQYDAMPRPPLEAEYRRIAVSGRFDHAHEQYFFATSEGEVGYHVYTPLRLGDGRTVFVNRGFVPEALKDPAKRAAGQIAGPVSVTGLVRATLDEKPSWIVPDNEPGKRLYFWKDLRAMASAAGIPADRLANLFIDADATPNPGGWPKGGVTQVDLPNNHLSYAVTWYGLAAVLLVVSVLAFRRKPG